MGPHSREMHPPNMGKLMWACSWNSIPPLPGMAETGRAIRCNSQGGFCVASKHFKELVVSPLLCQNFLQTLLFMLWIGQLWRFEQHRPITCDRWASNGNLGKSYSISDTLTYLSATGSTRFTHKVSAKNLWFKVQSYATSTVSAYCSPKFLSSYFTQFATN